MRRRLITVVVFLLLGALVNVAVIVLVVFVVRDLKPSFTESVTFYSDGQGVVRWKTETFKQATLGLALSKRERWPQHLEQGADVGEPDVPMWASRLTVPFDEFHGGLRGIEERVVVGRGWPLVAATFDMLDSRLDMAGFRTVPNERFQVRDVIDIGDPWNNSSTMPRLFPYRIAWPGFAINTLLYAVLLSGLFAVPLALRCRRRINRGLCPNCAYDLRGRPQNNTCPECGATR